MHDKDDVDTVIFHFYYFSGLQLLKGVTTVMINYTSFYTEIFCKLGTHKNSFGLPQVW